MKVLVTGASGLVGKKLLDGLINQGYSIHVLTHSEYKIAEFEQLGIKSFYWNSDEQIIDLDCFNQVDTIIHLAGASISKRWTKSYKKQIIDSRVNSTKLLYNLIKRLSNHQIKHFICASAIGIYPDDLNKKYDEKYKGKTAFFLADVVEQWEQAASLFEELGIKVSKLRTGLVLDTSSGALPLLILPTKYYFGTSFGSGKQIYSWIHVNDLVRMYIFILENNLSGTYNAVASKPVTCNTFMSILAKNLQTKIWLPAVPSWFLKLIMGDMAHLLIDGQYVVNDKIKENKFYFKFDDLDLAVKDCLK